MTSHYIPTNVTGNILNQGYHSNSPSFHQLDIKYVNQNGDLMMGDLNMNENKIFLNISKTCSLYTLQNDNVLETLGRFIIKNPQTNLSNSIDTKFLISEDEIPCNSKSYKFITTYSR